MIRSNIWINLIFGLLKQWSSGAWYTLHLTKTLIIKMHQKDRYIKIVIYVY